MSTTESFGAFNYDSEDSDDEGRQSQSSSDSDLDSKDRDDDLGQTPDNVGRFNSTYGSFRAFDYEVDDQGRQSQSSSDSELDSKHDLGQTPEKTGRFNAVYPTPDARSAAGSVAPRAKDKLARLCGGRKCILTHESAPRARIEVVHLLPRSTGATRLAQLEFALSLKYRQMHTDTTGNLEYLKSDLHRSFNDMGWFFLPELLVLQAILKFTNTRDRLGRSYKDVFPGVQSFKYRLVPLQLIKDNIAIWRRSDTPLSSDTPNVSSHFPPHPTYEQIYPIGLYPVPVFESLPVVESRANPFFIVANAGPKLAAGLKLLPTAWLSRSDISMVLVIWTFWMSMQPTAEWRAQSYVPRRRDNDNGRDRGTMDESQGHDPPERRRRHPSPSGVGHGLAHTDAAADLPELDRDRQSASIDSELLTHDAVRSVGFLERNEFLGKWLQEEDWTNES
ncbi:hypothetical protein C8F01DRAFT_1119460, partial [Mycena amicta]